MPEVLALDFDGVISDSLLEAYLITWRISGKFDPRLAPPEGSLPTLENIHAFCERNLEHWNSFKALVPFCNRSEDYLLAHRVGCGKHDINTQEEFNDFARNHTRQELERFHEEFYIERYSLADRDKDGLITVTDLYRYVYENVRAAEPRQTPELWTYGAEGDVLLAHSIRGAVIQPVPLPEELRLTLESPRPRVRETAIAELAEIIDTSRSADI